MKNYFVKEKGRSIVSRHETLNNAVNWVKRNVKPEFWANYLIGCWEDSTEKVYIQVVGPCYGE